MREPVANYPHYINLAFSGEPRARFRAPFHGSGAARDGPAKGFISPPSCAPRMMRPEKRCVSCGLLVGARGTTSFLCPSCGTETIGRCRQCRDQGVAYACPACGFRGP